MTDAVLSIEVAYAKPDCQTLLALDIPAGCTVLEAIERSGILQQHPEIDLTRQSVGVFSQPCSLDRVLEATDRIEIYRALLQDPKQARRNRALKK